MPLAKLTFLLTVLCPISATTAHAASGDPTTSSITVVVSDLASTKSAVKLYFYNLREKFLQPNGFVFKKVVQPDGQGKITLPVDLPNGEWAVAITQDTNNNDRLDKNMLGIPTEPFAFSNNIRPKFSAPDFNECKFKVSGPGQVINIALKE